MYVYVSKCVHVSASEARGMGQISPEDGVPDRSVQPDMVLGMDSGL